MAITIIEEGNLYRGIVEVPYAVNIGTSFVRWAVLGIGRNIAIPFNINSKNVFSAPKVVYSDGNDIDRILRPGFDVDTYQDSLRPPHPHDSLYVHQISDGVFNFFWQNYHNLHRFFEAKSLPEIYYLDHWSNYLLHGEVTTQNFPVTGFRSKDLYATTSAFKDFQGITGQISQAFYDYSVDGTLAPAPEYGGAAASMLRCMPAFRQEHLAQARTGTKDFPAITYRNSPRKGGAYYISAAYDQPDVTNYDVSTKENDSAYQGFLRGEYFVGFYHHDMYDADSQHLRPSTFIYACIKNAGMQPAFKQDGSDISGPLNNHKMQLIENTDKSYKSLIRRVLPSLGYALRLNAATREIEMVDLFTEITPKYSFSDNDMVLQSVRFDTSQQSSSFIFENADMVRGENTLEEFTDARERGRFVVYNSNQFISGRTQQIPTGTWTAEYDRIAKFLSARKDNYQFTVSNCVLLEQNGSFDAPAVGDWVRLNSENLPSLGKSVIVLVISKAQSESTTQYKAIGFDVSGQPSSDLAR